MMCKWLYYVKKCLLLLIIWEVERILEYLGMIFYKKIKVNNYWGNYRERDFKISGEIC